MGKESADKDLSMSIKIEAIYKIFNKFYLWKELPANLEKSVFILLI